MLNLLGVNLKGLYESEGAVITVHKLRAALEAGELKPEDFSLRELFEAFCGVQALNRLDPRNPGDMIIGVKEEAVDSTAFSNITGQILYNRIMQGWRDADQGLFDRMVTTIPTVFNGEKIPGVTAIDDEEFQVPEGMEFPRGGFGEDYLETPATTKYGQIVEVTKEAIFFDRTGLVLNRAATVGQRLAYGKMKRILKVIIGAVNNHKWKGTTYNTYQTALGTWINKKVSHTITDWSDLEEMELLWADMTNPDTGNALEMPIRKQVLCSPHKKFTMRRILNATEIRQGDGSAGNADTHSSNPLDGYEEPIGSALFYQLLQSALSLSAANAKNVVIIGNFPEAFWYMQNWPITVVPAPSNSEPEFSRDVVSRFKASERGVAFAREPRKVIWAQQHA